jgi:hypothetical protein
MQGKRGGGVLVVLLVVALAGCGGGGAGAPASGGASGGGGTGGSATGGHGTEGGTSGAGGAATGGSAAGGGGGQVDAGAGEVPPAAGGQGGAPDTGTGMDAELPGDAGADRSVDAGPAAGFDAMAKGCPAAPYFSQFPIDLDQIEHVSVLGGFSPPGHTIPTDHLGVYLKGVAIPFRAPANLQLWNLRRVTYVASPTRQGETDFAVEFKLCDTIVGIFGHMPTLSSRLMAMIQSPHCDRYSTADETVEACIMQNIAGVTLAAGEVLGTVGGKSAGAFDFDLYDYNHMNRFTNPERVAFLGRHAICPLEQFAGTDREFLLSHVSANGQGLRTAEPRCGTMDVDVEGTAQGLWVTKSNPINQMGDESAFVTLALDPGQPDDHLALAAGASGLGARLYRFPRLHSGRHNRDYAEIPSDGTIHCYDGDPYLPTTAILLSLDTSREVTLERVEATQGISACAHDPSTWAHTPAAIKYIR